MVDHTTSINKSSVIFILCVSDKENRLPKKTTKPKQTKSIEKRGRYDT